MSAATETTTVQIHRIYIKASPESIWDALIKPEWRQRYGYQGLNEYDLRPGGRFRSRKCRRPAYRRWRWTER